MQVGLHSVSALELILELLADDTGWTSGIGNLESLDLKLTESKVLEMMSATKEAGMYKKARNRVDVLPFIPDLKVRLPDASSSSSQLAVVMTALIPASFRSVRYVC